MGIIIYLLLEFIKRIEGIEMQKSQQSNRVSRRNSFSNFNEGPKELFQSGYGERFWLKNRGKEEFIAFSDSALVELRKYFDSLD